MSDHGWDGGDWPDGLDPDGGDLGPDTPDFGDADTADLGAFDHLGPDEHLDPMADAPDDLPDSTLDNPLDPAGDSTVDFPHAGGNAFDTVDTADGPDAGDGLDGPDGLDGDGPADGGADLPPVGADPDVDAHTDGWTDQSFPEPLDLDAPEPVDGFPWTDPATLGAAPLPDADAGYQGAPEANELAAYAGEEIPPGADPWTALSASDDPATSSLARWWAPDT
ncbi:hypothetical protein [Phytohabitans suffuscus]|uniref:Uncharacterized protein n=1 Tax=Phytohabitans suffuscus TaxID=624315 RepID=A0A6F8YXA5_9ACTN|nr:hypothetical protein [Phytohabitans suffuscus]BCB90633.1 hypothetical protein Psuf_079460 [Phytohabitans suffuscus]